MTAYLASNLWAIWTAIAIICLIIELGSGDFFLTCFALGAFCSMIVSFTEAPLWTQILVFAIVFTFFIIYMKLFFPGFSIFNYNIFLYNIFF